MNDDGGIESPDLKLAMRLLDFARRQGFIFGRTHGGVDAPLMGQRSSEQWTDIIYIEGFNKGENVATRRDKNGEVHRRYTGKAIGVINDALSWRTD